MARTLLGGLEHAFFIFFVSAARYLLVFAPIYLPRCWSAHKSLAPRARTLLGGLGHATLSFFAVATLLFVFFCESPKFCDLAKQRCKIRGGVSEVGRDDFLLYFFWRCVVFLVFFFFCCDRATIFLTDLCIPVHAYGALKGRPCVLRTVQPLFRLPRGSTLGSLTERAEFLNLACL